MSKIAEHKIGAIRVVALQDGEMVLPQEVLLNVDEASQRSLDTDHETLCHNNVNAYLIQSAGKTLLIDAGCRDLFGPTCGFLNEALAEAGVQPEDVTDLFLTHLHPDHAAGAIDASGAAVFANASLKVPTADYNFWMRDDFADVEVNGAGWAGIAKAVVAAYGDRVETLATDDAIISGVSMVPLPGHTPGHSGFRIDDGAETLVHMGDIVHAPKLQLGNPEVSVVFDTDGETAVQTRKSILDMICTDQTLCTAAHIAQPRFGRLERRGSGYILT